MRTASMPTQTRSRESRDRMLQAAVACLVDLGYAGTTTSAIQERARVSRGSLLHQFPAKDDLLVAAVARLALERKQVVEAPHTHNRRTATTRIDHAIELLWLAYTEPQFTAAVELWVAARHNAGLAATLAETEHEVGDATKEMMATLFGPNLAAHPRFSDFVSLLMAGMRGVVLTYFFDPRDPVTDPHLPMWKEMARRYLLDHNDDPARHRRG